MINIELLYDTFKTRDQAIYLNELSKMDIGQVELLAHRLQEMATDIRRLLKVVDDEASKNV